MLRYLFIALFFSAFSLAAQEEFKETIATEAGLINEQLINWRRTIHQNPELGNNELETAKLVANHLRSLGLDVQENIGVTGVVGLLKGSKPGKVVALRADMDALPVPERADLPFKSTKKVMYNGKETPIMHACGHDSHVAILMATASVLAKHKDQLNGSVKFIFQPAEEGVFESDKPFGANAMVKEGCLENPKVDAIFGLHINSQTPAGHIKYKPEATMAAVDQFYITIKGVQTHGAYPWSGADPIVAGSQMVMALQTIISRNVKLIDNPAVVSVGAFNGGLRHNIIPEEVKLMGTIRTLSKEQRTLIHTRIKEIIEHTAKSMGVTADLTIESGYPVTYNDPALSDFASTILKNTIGQDKVNTTTVVMGAEDFSYYQEKVPGFFFFLGAMEPGKEAHEVAPHHTPDFYLDETGFKNGVIAYCNLVNEYLNAN